MTDFLAIMALGLFLGMRHATDADHVVAVTTIVSRQQTPRAAALIGAAWGVGHTITLLVVGGAIIVFGWVIPPRVGLSTEFTVGLMLIVLGIMSLIGVKRGIETSVAGRVRGPGHVHTHAHAHGDYVHTHPHTHEPESHPHAADKTPLGWLDRRFGALGAYRLSRPLLVGVVHGLAGSAALALLVLATISTPAWGIVYLMVFGLGTIAGMMVMTAAIAIPFSYSARRFGRVSTGLRVSAGVLSIALGLFLAYRIGIVDGLFTGRPIWTPH